MIPASHEGRRRLIHLGSSVIPLGYWAVGRETAIVLLAAMTVLMLLLELARRQTTWGWRFYHAFMGPVTRPEEARRLTGASYVMVGDLAAAILFTPTIAILAMLFMSIGDPAAAFLGRRYGRTPIGDKTVEGGLGCFVVCFLLTLPAGLSLAVSVGGAAGASIAELVPRRWLNDNLTMPIISGAFMTLLQGTGQ